MFISSFVSMLLLSKKKLMLSDSILCISLGRGVFATRDICRGDFIVEYAGDLISGAEGEKRETAGQSGYRFFFTEKCFSYW